MGSQSGESTARLLELCGEIGAHVDVIDTVEMGNASEIAALLKAHGRFHKAPSLDVLPTLPAADICLIDGDHNWFTVMSELSAIHDAVEHAPDPGPVFILHDVEWPYARRDLYHDPTNVPPEGKQPIALGGIRPGRSEVVAGDGLNAHLHHADHEGGPAQAALLNVTESGRLSLGVEVEQARRKNAAGVATLQAVLAARDNRITNYERKMASIVESRGYRALQRARSMRRMLRRT